MSALLIRWLVVIGILLAAFGAGAAVMHKHDMIAYDALEVKAAKFEGGVAALGVAAEKRVADINAANKVNKEKADAENKRAVAALTGDIARLRADADRARGSFVPQAPRGSSCPDGQACFDGPQLERALRDFVEEVRGQSDEGSSVTIDLNTAKQWAQEMSHAGR